MSLTSQFFNVMSMVVEMSQLTPFNVILC